MTQTRTQTRPRRLSSCHLHPANPVAGICATCLSERLTWLDSNADTEPSSSNAGDGDGPIGGRRKSLDAAAPPLHELRRCRSVCPDQRNASAEPRRMSCDVRGLNGKTLAHLFDIADDSDGSVNYLAIESKKVVASVANELRDNDVSDEKVNEDSAEEEFKTMKDYIDLELQANSQKKEFKELAGNLWDAASVFSKKLQKWRQKQKGKKSSHGNDPGGFGGGDGEMEGGSRWEKFGNTQSETSEYAMGRRSCDTQPRFSVDGGRLSVDGGRISFDEPRASWDGYMIARTIPTLTPMFSVMDNAILAGKSRFDNHRGTVDGLMHSIMEDDTSSGGSGPSNSDSSTSQRRSSFDRSSSVRSFGKKLESLDVKYGANSVASPAKLVITEKELRNWQLNSTKGDQIEKLSDWKGTPAIEDAVNLRSKKSVGWRKVWSVFSSKQKGHQRKCENSKGGVVDSLAIDACENEQTKFSGDVKDPLEWGLMRSNSIVDTRRSFEVTGSNHNRRRSISSNIECRSIGKEELVLESDQSVKHVSTNFDDGPMPFYLTPLRTSRSRGSKGNKRQG